MRKWARRAPRFLVAWQIVASVVALAGWLWSGQEPRLDHSDEDERYVFELLHPDEAKIKATLGQAAALRWPTVETRPDDEEAQLTGLLRRADWRSALGAAKADDVKQAISLLLHDQSIERQVDLARLLSSKSFRYQDLDTWCWELWDHTASLRDKGRLAGILSEFTDGQKETALLTAAMPWADTRASDWLHRMGTNMLYANQSPMRALAVFQEAERRAYSLAQWGPAVHNQGIALLRAGHPTSARSAFKRLIESRVDDREPGASVMETNRNYRHRAAASIAASYREQWLYPMALYWSERAGTSYRFASWCGTCNDSVRFAISLDSTRDAIKSGPLALGAYLTVRAARAAKPR